MNQWIATSWSRDGEDALGKYLRASVSGHPVSTLVEYRISTSPRPILRLIPGRIPEWDGWKEDGR